MQAQHDINQHIRRIQDAMRKAGVWSDEIPEWIEKNATGQLPDIWQWLQYIYLPMRLNGQWYRPHYIAPVVSPYLNTTPELQEILRLVIELDSISSTFEKN